VLPRRLTAAAVSDRRADAVDDGEQILSPTAHGGSVLRADDQLFGEGLTERRVQRRGADALEIRVFRSVANPFSLVVQAEEIRGSRKRHVRLHEVHRGGRRTRGISAGGFAFSIQAMLPAREGSDEVSRSCLLPAWYD
jgi:hypothetical protein